MVKQYLFTNRFKELMEERMQEKFKSHFTIKQEVDLVSNGIKAPVDLKLSNPDLVVIIEYEIHRADPFNNIAKIAYWLATENPTQPVIVIQLLSPYYLTFSGRKKAKAILAEFLGH